MMSEAKTTLPDSSPSSSVKFAAFLEEQIEEEIIEEVPKDEENIQDKKQRALLMERKLVLLINMDTVLIDSVDTDEITMAELLAYRVIRDLYKRNQHDKIFNLRPFVRKFLEEASKMFEIWIFTTFNKKSVEGIIKHTDPDGVYFPSRIITREQEHNIEIGPETMMIILDDSGHGWEENKNNLIMVKGYHFFTHTAREYDPDSKSVTQLGIDESASDGILARMLVTLRRIHERFFDQVSEIELSMRDVRQILPALRKEILHDCRISFCETQLDLKKFQTLAKAMGASLCPDSDESVTHAVATVSNTSNAKADRFLVNPYWIEAAFYNWKRPNEGDFAVP